MAQASQLQELTEQVEAIGSNARALLSGLTDAQLWQRPPAGGWSVGECLAHLNTAGRLYLEKLDPALTEARAEGVTGQGPFRVGFIGSFFARSQEPPVRLKLRAPRAFAPGSGPQAGVTEAFYALQDALRSLIERADGLDLGCITVSSPVTNLLRFNVFEAMSVVLAHERRHLWQAARVREVILS
ncbi:MAG: hypothetical protein AVDCRST_MAG86-3954 [uncultured Truepera sp.]|uniref:DinB-like domain-containing protein n=1 Tax=uncultured Truepera sp. TaxID=543023 RepID=A0A6J4VTQ5_9DEIN|nr:MAG: hypothetical protein AVDCRST_MAG86-3954 [uncultured Truepera sp.]